MIRSFDQWPNKTISEIGFFMGFEIEKVIWCYGADMVEKFVYVSWEGEGEEGNIHVGYGEVA